MNQAVANRLLRLALTVEAADGKLDEVLALLRPIATPVGVIRTPEGWGDTPPPAPGPPPPGLGLTEPGSVSQWGKIHPPSEETQRAVGEHIVERLSSPVLLDWRGAPHGAAVLAALHEFGYEVEDGTGAGDAVRAALHAERRARDAANVEAGKARAEANAERERRREADVTTTHDPLRPIDVDVLDAIRERGPSTVPEIARHLGRQSNDGTVRRSLVRLVNGGRIRSLGVSTTWGADVWEVAEPVERDVQPTTNPVVAPGEPGRRRWWGRRRR